MKIVLELWQLISLLLTGAGILVGVIRWGAGQIKTSLDLRMAGVEKAIDGWREQERQLLQLRAELAEKYLRREDYIRGQTVIEAKLDAINADIKTIQIQGAKREH